MSRWPEMLHRPFWRREAGKFKVAEAASYTDTPNYFCAPPTKVLPFHQHAFFELLKQQVMLSTVY